jgi:DNA-binding NarL/FixJ family response regulator
VIIFSAYASPELALSGRLARADGIISKGLGARELFEAIRRVNAGENLVGDPSAAALYEAQAVISEEDRAIIGMLLDGTAENEIARTLGREVKDVRHAVQKTLSALRHSAPIAG